MKAIIQAILAALKELIINGGADVLMEKARASVPSDAGDNEILDAFVSDALNVLKLEIEGTDEEALKLHLRAIGMQLLDPNPGTDEDDALDS